MTTELDQYLDDILARQMVHYKNPLNTPGHQFVSNYLKEQRNLGHIKTLEDGQEALSTAWKLAREKGLVKNPTDRNPIGNRDDYEFRGRSMEMRQDQVEDAAAAYYRVVAQHGERSRAATQALARLTAAQGRLYGERNPRMNLGYYANKPESTVVVVREYERRLPKRKVDSHEKEYKRVKGIIADVVRESHEDFGDKAEGFEASKLGVSKDRLARPVGNRRAARKGSTVKKNPSFDWKLVIGGMLALFGLTAISRMTDSHVSSPTPGSAGKPIAVLPEVAATN